MSNMHIYAPSATAKMIVRTQCSDCRKHTRLLAFFTPWYGWKSTCIRCGRQWEDGYRIPLEFSRFARKQNIDSARRTWRAMPPMSDNHFGLDP